MKRNRQEKILELISRYEIDTQEELIARLRDAGYEATQATASRDIRELKLIKMNTGRGTYRYALPKQSGGSIGVRFNSALTDSIVSVEYACNTVVIKTYPGLAQAVASGIDKMELQQILGCVAGDDTIITIVRDEESASMITSQIHDLLRNL